LKGTSSAYAYSIQIYRNKYQTNQSPEITTDFDKIEAAAKALLSPEVYNYAAGGCGMESSTRANRAAFDKVGYTQSVRRCIR
jgi:hypothetical protein